MVIPQLLLDEAFAGNAQAMLDVGRHHAEGRGVSYDLEAAFKWFSLAARLDHPDALLEVALAKEYGFGTDRDPDAAFATYMHACRLHPKPLPFTLRGVVLTQALCLEKHHGQLALAEAGFAHAQWALAYGPTREHQWRSNKDTPKWIRRAAALGYPAALRSMAWLISAGEATDEEKARHLEWYLKAYEHDKLVSKSISMLYEEPGRLSPSVGLPPVKAEETRWNRIWQGHIRERRVLEAVAGSVHEARGLAEIYLNGSDGVEQDYEVALRWLHKASELGCTWSAGQIGKMYLAGTGVPADIAKGLAWFDRQYDRVHCYGTDIPDQGLIYHWAMRTVVEGFLDDLDEDGLFAWLQKRTRVHVPGCGALQGSYYGDSESARVAAHVCKAFTPHVHAPGVLGTEMRRIVEFRIGRITRLMKRQEEAMVERAKEGDAAAQFWFSKSFARYKRRAGRALQWLLKSAEQGFSPAQYEAGKAYVEGDGAPVSESDARKWLLKASYQGHTWAQDELIRVLNGTQFWGDREEGVERLPAKEDILEAYSWSIASRRRLGESSSYKKLSPEKVLAAYLRADEIRAAISKRVQA